MSPTQVKLSVYSIIIEVDLCFCVCFLYTSFYLTVTAQRIVWYVKVDWALSPLNRCDTWCTATQIGLLYRPVDSLRSKQVAFIAPVSTVSSKRGLVLSSPSLSRTS